MQYELSNITALAVNLIKKKLVGTAGEPQFIAELIDLAILKLFRHF